MTLRPNRFPGWATMGVAPFWPQMRRERRSERAPIWSANRIAAHSACAFALICGNAPMMPAAHRSCHFGTDPGMVTLLNDSSPEGSIPRLNIHFLLQVNALMLAA
jgi:hypothetical protein